MAHDHGHAHHAAPDGYDRAFALGIGLNLAYVAVEAGFGLVAGSLALLADAGHNLSDVLGLALAWGASWLARREPTARRTYGMRRSSILAALVNAMLLLVAVGAIAWEAIQRLQAPEPVATGIVLWVRPPASWSMAGRRSCSCAAASGTSTFEAPSCTWRPTPGLRRERRICPGAARGCWLSGRARSVPLHLLRARGAATADPGRRGVRNGRVHRFRGRGRDGAGHSR